MTVRWTVRATEPTAVFSPQRKYKTVGSSPSPATRKRKTNPVVCLSFSFAVNACYNTTPIKYSSNLTGCLKKE